jgi:hypothetical protein
MARTSTPWRLLPAREFGCGSPATCWRRLAEWAGAGGFDQLHLEVLDRLGEHGQLDWSRASVDAMSVHAKRGGPGGRKSSRPWQAWKQAPPGPRRWRAAADRRQRQRHQHVRAVLDDVPAVGTPAGRRRGTVHADEGDDSAANRASLRRRGIRPRTARRRIEPSTRLGRHRWRVGRSLSWPGLLAAPSRAVGPGLGALVRVRAAGRCGRLPQPARAAKGGSPGPCDGSGSAPAHRRHHPLTYRESMLSLLDSIDHR